MIAGSYEFSIKNKTEVNDGAKKCKECGKEVSARAKTCPHCGVKKPIENRLVNFIIGIGVIFFLGLMCSVLGDSDPEVNAVADRFSTVSLNVRSGPSTDHEVISTLVPGEQLRVITDSLGWIRISSLKNKTVGWVSKKYTLGISEFENWQDQQEAIRQRQEQIAEANAWKTDINKTMAYIMIRDFVKKRLKAPATAEFPGVWDGYDYDKNITYLNNQTYLIISYVDAENSFGAKVRTRFVGKIKQTAKDEWALVELDM